MQYSPKLKKAISEIEEILRKHDIAGLVVLHTPGFSEYIHHITPSYSCAKINGLTNSLELKAKKIHFSNETERINKLGDTANMFRLLSETAGLCTVNLMESSQEIDRVVGATHGGTTHSSETEQNN